jgi:hypothetical protein
MLLLFDVNIIAAAQGFNIRFYLVVPILGKPRPFPPSKGR